VRQRREVAAVLLAAPMLVAAPAFAQLRFRTESDRAAFRAWFVLLADAQFYRTTPDVTDCAALVRHAVREAVRPHTAEWVRLARLPQARLAPELRDRPAARSGALPLFLIDAGPPARHGEFADARTIVRLNARWLGRDTAALQPGDLLYFHQPNQTLPDHLMVFVGSSPLEPGRHDWVVYHTGPDAGAAAASAAPAGHDGGPRAGPARRPAPLAGTRAVAEPGERPRDAPPPLAGEVRKVSLADLRAHPSPRWRPVPANPAFVGVFRLLAIG
jgi:uncharacterized protein YfaT (DUF1175 family)